MAIASSSHLAVQRPSDILRGCVVGTFLLCYLVAFSRWGTHIRIPNTPIYITELLLIPTCVVWLRSGGFARLRARGFMPLLPVLAIAALAFVRLLAGRMLTVDALRDATPYGYAAVAVLALSGSTDEARRRSTQAIRAALTVHLALVMITIAFPRLQWSLPKVGPTGPDERILSLRPDLTCALLSVLACLSLVRLLRDRFRPQTGGFDVLRLAGSVGVVFWISSRAGLLALIMCFAIIAATDFWPRIKSFSLASRIALAVLAVAVVAIGGPRIGAADRIADIGAGLGIGVDATKQASLASGTVQARVSSWKTSVNYTNETTARRFFGVGLGPDFLHDSGAAVALEGETYTGVRAPHNYLVNTYARFGIVGLITVLIAITSVLVAAFRALRRRRDEFDLMLVLLVSGILVISMFGVVLESPFGAVPFFWAAGWLITDRADPTDSAAVLRD